MDMGAIFCIGGPLIRETATINLQASATADVVNNNRLSPNGFTSPEEKHNSARCWQVFVYLPTLDAIDQSTGVIGLTSAVKIQESGKYNVSLLADVLPTDQKNTRYTSHWAGAHHVLSATEDPRQQKMDLETFKVMWELSTPGTDTAQYFMRLLQTEYYSDPKLLPPLDCMPDYVFHDSATLPFNAKVGVTFKTVTIDTPNYLLFLARRFTASGGKIVRASVQHINQVLEGGADVFTGASNPTPPHAVVVCTGLGTRFLGGIEDQNMCPELAPPEVRAEREPTLEDVLPLVIEEGCGLRPARKGGVRLEFEWRRAGEKEILVPIVFNYGHGGYGFQGSWGSADIALTLLEEALEAKV
ncbi:hypothetical protein H0H93_002234 [Arthromyces matolae]|nr:hypothetical protein H0H93_002234 [Arthromyces matolae]